MIINCTNMVLTGWSGSVTTAKSYSYDAADQLAGVTYKTGSTTDRIVGYQYDAAGNRTNMLEILGTATNTTVYTADADNQLTSATADRQGITVTGYVEPGPRSNKWYASTAAARGQQSAVSGQNGTFAIPGVPVTGGANALTVTVTDVSGNVATQVVNVTVVNGSAAIGYDANGNQTNHNNWAMAYDRENRLASASSASLAVHYRYDALGRLVERIAGNSTNRLYYAGWQLIAEYDGDGNLQRKYVYGPGIDEPIRMTTSGTNYYYHADGLGSVTEITGSTGSLVESYRYDVYGKPAFFDSSFIPHNSSLISNRLLFTGRDYDPDTSLYNYRYRYYNPTLGRFVQPDPVRTKGSGGNLYWYCNNQPVNFRDPAGLCMSGAWNANEAYDYWLNVASHGLDQGGLLGILEGLGASLMTSFIDFFGARGVQNSSEQWGTAVGNGDTTGAIEYGVWTVAQIGISALAGYTGGGGAAATEVRTFKQAVLYELGSQTIKGEVFRGIQNMSAMERGQYLLKNYGLKETLLPTGALRPGAKDWLITLRQGPTPAGYLGMLGVRQGIQSSQP